eukprot:m.9914 g.9914  ORF g.9914 m.9914 type:complete len:272 (-) comp3570_c0_seq1:405-1220(-)
MNLEHSIDTESTVDAPIFSGMLAKRAQGRSTFGRTNWKRRWFVLFPNELSYWTLEGGFQNQQSECKGVIKLSDIHTLERVHLEAFGKPYMLQIVHSSVLYVQCSSRAECDEWLLALRKQCARNEFIHTKYHPGFFDGSKWSCCNIASKDYKGCERAFDYSTLLKKNTENQLPKKKRSFDFSPNTRPVISSNTASHQGSSIGFKQEIQATASSFQQQGGKRPLLPKQDSVTSVRDFSYIPSVKSPQLTNMTSPTHLLHNEAIVVKVKRVVYV